MEKEFIKSPLNYTGNKFRILNQILPNFPKTKIMVDLFCGGGTVGVNIECDKVYFIDRNEKVINLLKFLNEVSFDEIIKEIEKIISKYELSNSYRNGYKFYRSQCQNKKDNNGLKEFNKEGYNKLKNDYNSLKNKNSKKANLMLYVLMIYAFNNDIRFNSSGEFNLPIGKTDFNKQNVKRLKSYIDAVKKKEIIYICADFDDTQVVNKIFQEVDFVYMDPPYLLGDAVYNSSWNELHEAKLLNLLTKLLENKINFALSNVLKKGDRYNKLLKDWIEKNQTKITIDNVNYHYRSASYNKKNRDAKEQEILVRNKEYYEN